MTSPDGFEPLGAANYSSLAAFAAKTQEDWEDEIRGEQETRWGTGVLGGLFQGLQQGKPFVVSLITAILGNGFGPDDGEPDGPFANATEALTSLRNRFRAKWGEIRTAAETEATAIIAAMDRSMPPAMTTTAIPQVASANGSAARARLSRPEAPKSG